MGFWGGAAQLSEWCPEREDGFLGSSEETEIRHAGEDVSA